MPSAVQKTFRAGQLLIPFYTPEIAAFMSCRFRLLACVPAQL